MLYNPLQYNTMDYNTIQNITIQCSAIQYNAIQYNTMPYNTIKFIAIQYNALQCKTFYFSLILLFTQFRTGDHRSAAPDFGSQLLSKRFDIFSLYILSDVSFQEPTDKITCPKCAVPVDGEINSHFDLCLQFHR